MEDRVPELKQYLNSGGQTVRDKYASIERYLKRCVDPLPGEQVFDEADPKLTYEELYVPLSVQKLDAGGERKVGQPVLITDWVEGILSGQFSSRQVMFLQGEAGRGKSVFCRMLASRVRDRFANAWVPILIRLREVHEVKDSLSETLKIQLENEDFVQSDRDWLTDLNIRFLLIFDGFDELLLEGRESGGLKDFLQQVAKFQESSHHQCLITGRPLALQGIDRQLTRIGNLSRARLEQMTDDQRVQWLAQWGQKFTAAEASAFCDFLAACPDEISNVLAREPLLLYLLGRLHREEKETFNAQMFEQAKGLQARIQVYDQSIRWVLGKQRQKENIRLAGLETEELREVLQEAALCVVQSGNEVAKLSMLRQRFTEANNPVSRLFEQAQQETRQGENKALNNLLTTFYLQPGKGDKAGSVEFAHKSFGEFLFAERLSAAFEDWVELDRRGRPRLGEQEVAKQIYDLFGYGALTVEIVDYWKALIFSSAESDEIVRFFQRLHRFYKNWCEGFYIDGEPGENLPQSKMMQLRNVDIATGLRQVDIYAGLNVMILLFELHHYGQQHEGVQSHSLLHFHPCGIVSENSSDSQRLFRITGYSQIVRLSGFVTIVGSHLHDADLSDADLSGVDLSRTNLIGADLSGANLSDADLSGANLSDANLKNVRLDNETSWQSVEGLETARNALAALKQQLNIS